MRHLNMCWSISTYLFTYLYIYSFFREDVAIRDLFVFDNNAASTTILLT